MAGFRKRMATPLMKSWRMGHSLKPVEICRFIRTAEDDESRSWEVALAKKYYSKLFREYCIADLSRYQVFHPPPHVHMVKLS